MKTDIHTYGAAGLAGAVIFGFTLTKHGLESHGTYAAYAGTLLGLAIAHIQTLLFPRKDPQDA